MTKETIKLSYGEWVDQYKPTTEDPLQWGDVRGTELKFIWTRIDTGEEDDEGFSIILIISGLHVVNRLDYFITEISHDHKHIEVD